MPEPTTKQAFLSRLIGKIDLETWCLRPHFKTRTLYGNRTSNAVESANSMLRPERCMEPLCAIDARCFRQAAHYTKH